MFIVAEMDEVKVRRDVSCLCVGIRYYQSIMLVSPLFFVLSGITGKAFGHHEISRTGWQHVFPAINSARKCATEEWDYENDAEPTLQPGCTNDRHIVPLR